MAKARVCCLSSSLLHLSRPQSLFCRDICRDLPSLSQLQARGRRQLSTGASKHGQHLGKRAATSRLLGVHSNQTRGRGARRGGDVASASSRRACSSTPQETSAHEEGSKKPAEQASERLEKKASKKNMKVQGKGKSSTTNTPSRQKAKVLPEGTAEECVTKDTKPLKPSPVAMAIPEEWADLEVMGAKVKDAKVATMREQVGKGKVEITPIAVLPSKDKPHPQYYQLGTKVRVDYNDVVEIAKQDNKKRRVYTNEHFIPDTFEFTHEGFSSEEADSLMEQVAPHVRKIVLYLLSELGVSKRDAQLYLRSAPSVLGVSLDSLQEEVEELRGLGFSERQVAWIVPRFPSTLTVDWGNLRGVYEVMVDEVGMTEATVITLMKRHPFLFTLQSSTVKGGGGGGRQCESVLTLSLFSLSRFVCCHSSSLFLFAV